MNPADREIGRHANFFILQLECGSGDTQSARDFAEFLRSLKDDAGEAPVMTVAYIPERAPDADGVIRSESATDTGSTAPSKMIAIALRMLAPATFGAGTVAIGFRPAATPAATNPRG